jgi:DNA-binding protein HU-beta
VSHPTFAFIDNLQQFPGWPSHGSKEILRLNKTIEAVKARLHSPNLETQKGDEADGLGPYESLLFKDADIGFVALVTHTHAPYKGTDVIVDAETSLDSAIRRVTDVLKLSKNDVAWVHPESKMAKQLATDSRPLELTTKPRKRDLSASTIPLSKVAAELAAKTDMTKKDATGALEDFIDLVVKHLKKGNKVRITGLGILQVRNRPARMGRNPATGEAIKIKAAKKVSFRAAKDLKDVV